MKLRETEYGDAFVWTGDDDRTYFELLADAHCGECGEEIASPTLDNLDTFGYIGMDDMYAESGFWTCDACLAEEDGTQMALPEFGAGGGPGLQEPSQN